MEDDSRGDNFGRVQELKPEASKTKKKKLNTPKGTNRVSAKKAKGQSRLSVRHSGTSFLESFKNEWALFWAGLQGDEGQLEPEVVEALSPLQIKEITKALSEQKKILNQKMESIAKEIDLNVTKLQSLKLAGLESPETEKRVSELTDMGQEISTELGKLDERLRKVRGQERAAAKLAAVF